MSNAKEIRLLGSGHIRHWGAELVPRVGPLARDTVSVNFIDRILRAAVNMGASRPRLLAAIHLTDASLRNPIGSASRAVLINLFGAIEREFADPAIGIRLVAAARPGCFSDLGYIALFAPTVGDVIGTTVEIQGMRQNIWSTRFDRESSPSLLVWDLPGDMPVQLAACIEFSVASYVKLHHHSLPTRPSCKAVRFSHAPRFEPDRYKALLGCPVFFGADSSCIEFDYGQLRLASPRANRDIQDRIIAVYRQPMRWLAEGKRHAAFSYLYLSGELNKSPLTLARLAASFGLSERTLRRKLVEEGHPFRLLLEKVRRDFYGLYRMENSRSITQVAELLGYAELSAFTRAHRHWFGQPPSMVDGVPTC